MEDEDHLPRLNPHAPPFYPIRFRHFSRPHHVNPPPPLPPPSYQTLQPPPPYQTLQPPPPSYQTLQPPPPSYQTLQPPPPSSYQTLQQPPLSHQTLQPPPPVTNVDDQKKYVRCSLAPVSTGPRNKLQRFTRRRKLPPVNGGVHGGKKFREIIPLNQDDPTSTSVMIRNIPNNYTRSLLVEFLENHCKVENEKAGNKFRSAFDFVYLPIDFKYRLNAGYAFVNFTTSEAALRFHACVKGKKWDLFESKKIADVSRARIQGKDAFVKHFERMRFCSPSWEYLPVWFEPPRDGCMLGAGKMHTIGEVKG